MYVTGPAHIFVGVPVWGASLLRAKNELKGNAGKQSELKAGGSGLPSGGGAKIDNGGPPVPAAFSLFFRGWVPFYLGAAKISPAIKFEPRTVPWRDDEFSTSESCGELYDGEEATVVADLNYWQESVYQWIAARTKNLPIGGGLPGVDFAGSVGTEMVFELQNYPLWIQFPNSLKPVNALRGMFPGYRFYSARLSGDSYDGFGHVDSVRRLTWHCRRILDYISGHSVLYDWNMTGLPLLGV